MEPSGADTEDEHMEATTPAREHVGRVECGVEGGDMEGAVGASIVSRARVTLCAFLFISRAWGDRHP